MKYANPAPLGLFGFALTTWLLSMINAGWFSPAGMGMILAMAFAFGGTAQFIAGVLEMPRGNTFGFVAFCSYGAFWWSFALFAEFLGKGVTGGMVGWYLFLWGIFTAVLWAASVALSRATFLIFFALTITFFLLAFGAWSGAGWLTTIGGYFGLLTAIFAGYLGAADVINETLGRVVLPVGAPRLRADTGSLVA